MPLIPQQPHKVDIRDTVNRESLHFQFGLIYDIAAEISGGEFRQRIIYDFL